MISRTNLLTSAGFLIVIVMMTAMATLSISGMLSIQRQLKQVAQVNAEKLQHIAIMRRSNRDRIIGLQYMLILEDPFEIDEIAMAHMGHANKFIAARSALYEMADSTDELTTLDRIRTASMIAAPINEEIRELVLNEQQDEAKTLMIEKLSPVQDNLYDQFEVLAKVYQEKAKAAIQTAETNYDVVYNRTIAILAIVVCLCVLIAIKVTRRIDKSEKSLVDHTDKLERTVDHRTKELKQESKRLAVTLASIGDGVVTINTDRTIRYMNPAAELLTQLDHSHISGEPVDQVLRSINLETGDEYPLLDFDEQNIAEPHNKYILRANGEFLDIHQTVANITDANGHIDGQVVVLRDVSEARALERKLAHQATHDPLTGLVNRREFEARVDNSIKRAIVDNSVHALCYLDLDQFKVVNDSCGHAVGDRLLCEISDQVKAILRKNDTFARLGGDEFGLLFEECSSEKGREIAENVRNTIKQYQISHDGQIYSVGVSIGLVEITSNTKNLETLFRISDAACYTAKGKGGGAVQYFGTEDDVNQIQGETRWAKKIRQVIDNNEFELFCQPIVSTQETHPNNEHYEVLMRIRNTNDELILPGEFLPAAERYGLLSSIDRCIIDKAFTWIGNHKTDLGHKRISINVAGDSLSDSSFLDFVTHCFKRTGASPANVIFEITENVAITNFSAAIKLMETLKKLGSQFSLDDFGRGFSSLGSLKDLPVDYLKIDGGFVSGILENPTDEATVVAINEIGHALGKSTVAEYVENQAIRERVARLGVDFVQGFGIAKPRPIDEVIKPSIENQTIKLQI